VNMILRKTAPVMAFTSARRVDGGTGAINVLLKYWGQIYLHPIPIGCK
jgi:DNA-nicking Smr family endonuclease